VSLLDGNQNGTGLLAISTVDTLAQVKRICKEMIMAHGYSLVNTMRQHSTLLHSFQEESLRFLLAYLACEVPANTSR